MNTRLRSLDDGRWPRAPTDLLLASADAALRRRLVQRLRREPGIHVARDRAGVERALAGLSPPVLVLDFSMRGFQRLESLRMIRALSPTTGTILLIESPDDDSALRALKEGARGYCARTTEPGLVVRAIQLVRQGEIWVGRKVMLRLIEELAALHARRRTPRTKVILLTTRQTSDALILEALHRGARGYLDAAAAPAFLAKAVRAVHAGEAWVPRRMGPKIHDRVTRLAAAERKARRGRAGATRAARSSRQAWRHGAAS